MISIYIKKYGSRNWAVYDHFGILICVTVYKKGAMEVLNRLSGKETGIRYSAPTINLREIVNLHKELKCLNSKFNKILQETQSGNKLNDAV